MPDPETKERQPQVGSGALVGLAVMPVRIAVSLLIFAPVLLVLALFEKVGEWLQECCGDLAERWHSLGKEWQYLTNGAQRKQAIEAVRENQILKEQLRLLRVSDDGPNGQGLQPAGGEESGTPNT